MDKKETFHLEIKQTDIQRPKTEERKAEDKT